MSDPGQIKITIVADATIYTADQREADIRAYIAEHGCVLSEKADETINFLLLRLDLLRQSIG